MGDRQYRYELYEPKTYQIICAACGKPSATERVFKLFIDNKFTAIINTRICDDCPYTSHIGDWSQDIHDPNKYPNQT